MKSGRPVNSDVGRLLNLMSLQVFWQTERGEILESCAAWYNPWDYIDDLDELKDTCCLRFVDEYGDATFNQYQLPVLAHELESILAKSKTPEAKESLESLIAFVRRCENNVHTYVKFVGD